MKNLELLQVFGRDDRQDRDPRQVDSRVDSFRPGYDRYFGDNEDEEDSDYGTDTFRFNTDQRLRTLPDGTRVPCGNDCGSGCGVGRCIAEKGSRVSNLILDLRF